MIPLSEKEKLEVAKEEEIEFFRGGKVSPGPTSNPAGDDDDETSRDSEVDPTYSSIESLLLSKNVVPVRESVASSFASAYEEEETGLQLPATATTTTTTKPTRVLRAESSEMKTTISDRHAAQSRMMTFAAPDLLKVGNESRKMATTTHIHYKN